MPPEEVEYRASTIRKSGDLVNDAVNFWSDAPLILDGASLPVNCFGKIGEDLGLRDEYERTRARAITKLNDGTTTLIQNREAVYTTADRYEGAEKKTVHVVRRHRRDLADERDGYEAKYGWARDT